MMGWYQDGLGWGGWLLMSVMMVAIWGLVIFAVVAIFRGSGKGHDRDQRPSSATALDILKERFARGEIDAQEYEAHAQLLRDETVDHTSRVTR